LIQFTSGHTPDSAISSDSVARVRVGMKLLISSWFNNRLPFEKGLNATADIRML
jgi:hypothetical protein